jgi:polysaccharide export outer membrane protein
MKTTRPTPHQSSHIVSRAAAAHRPAESPSPVAQPPDSRRVGRHLLGGAVAALLLTVLVGCQSAAPTVSTMQDVAGNGGAERYGEEPLREGDEIAITCENVTNLNTVVKIPLSGYIDLPFIDRVRAAGKTTMALQEELVQRYASQVRAEVITVKLVKADSSVYVSGAVLTPGKIPLSRPMTALDAIMEAGGFDPRKARMSKVMVLRIENGKQQSYELNLEKALKGDSKNPFYLRPYDIVQVPVRTFNW